MTRGLLVPYSLHSILNLLDFRNRVAILLHRFEVLDLNGSHPVIVAPISRH